MRRIIEDLHTDNTLDPTDRIESLAAANKHQTDRSDWILEHWPNVVEYLELGTITADAGPLDHWPTPLPATAQTLYNQLAANSVDTPQPRTLHELDQALVEISPAHQANIARHHRNELRTQIEALRADTDPAGAAVRDEHLARLKQRRDDTTKHIEYYDGLRRLDSWNPQPDPELTQAIKQRINHLAHHAITTHAHWVPNLIDHATTNNADLTVDELQQLVADVAAYRERADVNGPDPLGPSPVDTDPLSQTHRSIQTRIEATVAVTRAAGMSIE